MLSTYDGARFIDAQLASLAQQTHPDWSLVWRDDGSKDDTAEHVRRFALQPGIRSEDISDGRRLGITGSFWHLLRNQADRVARDGAYLTFADQDDVWLAEKLARAVAALEAVDPAIPALYCARQRLVDADLRPLGLSPDYSRLPGFPAALTQNIATGCTVALNPAATALLAQTTPPQGTLHDWWAYLMVTAAGGRMIVDPEPTVLYRQHGGNAVGAPNAWITRAFAALCRGPGVFMHVFRAHLAGLAEHERLITPAARQTVAQISASLHGNRIRRLGVLSSRLRRRTVSETLLFRVWFLLG